MDMSKAWVMLSPGEIADRISVLELKKKKGFDVEKELNDFKTAFNSLGYLKDISDLRHELDKINALAWDKIDRIYEMFESEKFVNFVETFTVCREAHFLNKERVITKNKISEMMGCKEQEQKSWKPSTI